MNYLIIELFNIWKSSRECVRDKCIILSSTKIIFRFRDILLNKIKIPLVTFLWLAVCQETISLFLEKLYNIVVYNYILLHYM